MLNSLYPVQCGDGQQRRKWQAMAQLKLSPHGDGRLWQQTLHLKQHHLQIHQKHGYQGLDSCGENTSDCRYLGILWFHAMGVFRNCSCRKWLSGPLDVHMSPAFKRSHANGNQWHMDSMEPLQRTVWQGDLRIHHHYYESFSHRKMTNLKKVTSGVTNIITGTDLTSVRPLPLSCTLLGVLGTHIWCHVCPIVPFNA